MTDELDLRNAEIAALSQRGMTLADLAEQYDMSVERVRVIVRDFNPAAQMATTRTISALIKAASDVTKLPPEKILGKCRSKPIVRARQAIMYLAQRDGHSYPTIGKRLNRDHSSVIHGAKLIAQLIESGDHVAHLVNAIDTAAPKRGEAPGEVLEGFEIKEREQEQPLGSTGRTIVTRDEMARIMANKVDRPKRDFWEPAFISSACGTVLLNQDGYALDELQFRRMLKRGSERLAAAIFEAWAA